MWMSLGGAFGATLVSVLANTVTLKPSADTTLFEFTPDNNSGRNVTLVVGGINKSESACRALLRFSLGTNLPAGAVITNVSLKLSVTKEKGGSPALQMRVHRVLQEWIEGTRSNMAGGSPAAAGEATWNARKHGVSNWSAPGGTGDFAATASATIAVDNNGNYTIPSNDALLADVRDWQANSAANFGWILLAPQEETLGSARRIASREDGSQAPSLTIGFTLPPPVSPPIAASVGTDGQLEITFPGQIGVSYEVQQRSVLEATPWNTAATLAATQDGALTHRVPISDASTFFRIILKP